MSRKISAVLIDLSGTIHIEDHVIPGSIEALKKLREKNVKIKFVTNTTKESKNTLHQRLTKIGFTINKDEIFTSLVSARRLLESKNLRPKLLVSPEALEEFEGIPQDDPNAVVVGLAPACFHYESMVTAFRHIQKGAQLIAIHKARYFRRDDGLALGPGPFVAALEYASGVDAIVVGKPEKSFFLSALADFNCDPEEAVMIGDDARDDVNGAMNAGIQGILVKTGKYTRGDEEKVNPPPDFVAENFSEAVHFIISQL